MNIFLFLKKKKSFLFHIKNRSDFLKLFANLNVFLQNKSDFFIYKTKTNFFFFSSQNRFDIFEPEDFVLLNKTDLIFFLHQKLFCFFLHIQK